MKSKDNLDSADRFEFISQKIRKKPALMQFYLRAYHSFNNCLGKCPKQGIAVEIGSGGGFAKTLIPELVTSDIIPYQGINMTLDATKMSFDDNSLKAIFMLNVFHHIPDVESFLKEASRCLMPGGRILIVDQHLGFISRIILKYFHHEGYDPKTLEWKFQSSGPLSGANTSLAWVVFQRDIEEFKRKFESDLKVIRYDTHTPLLYWLSGGLKSWSLAPAGILGFIKWVEHCLLKIHPNFGSFVDIEIVKN